MAAPRKYPDELRERATRMAVELRQDPATKQGEIARVAEQLGMHPETLVLAAGARLCAHQPNDDQRIYLDPAGHPFCMASRV